MSTKQVEIKGCFFLPLCVSLELRQLSGKLPRFNHQILPDDVTRNTNSCR